VQVALSVYDDTALRGGIVDRCAEKGIALIAHSPLGGPRRAPNLMRQQVLAEVAEARTATAAEVALAWLLELSPLVIPIPGARRPDTARSAAGAAKLRLVAGDRAILGSAFARPRSAQRERQAQPPNVGADVVLVMGIPGAGKSRLAHEYVARGYRRLNRDERGGSLRMLADALDEELSSGVRRIVLDNTYLTRAARSDVIEAARRHRAPTRCVWLDTPLAQAQINMVERLVERFGSLPSPEELRVLARQEPGVLMPTSQMRALRELEAPAGDEGFASVEHMQFIRTPPAQRGQNGVFVAAAALTRSGWRDALASGHPGAPHLVFDWAPEGTLDALVTSIATIAAEVSGPVEAALCPHAAGPPSCWCRPPLPGLPLVFARAHGIDPSRSTLIGAGPAHRTLATALGARYVAL
jgi:predicted kinase/histidinol phosphatase-like enzyme